ncbi:MAG TPA: DUF2235 domain-containing protein [Candidatus Acidoferrum sp.]|nr:DUF2235 domain-containing protein [Candidatus Acidoferrum sp.]
MNKNIVICCDGTGNEYGDNKSNVLKLFSALVIQPGVQTAYYHPGVGTMGARNALSALGKAWTQVRGLAFGYGLSDNIADAYQYLMNEFEDTDKIYLFGFSRGAYIVRALCAMLHMFGLLRTGNEGMIPYAMRLFKSSKEDKFRLAAGFQQTFSRECKPHFLGVWDTVSSVGWVLDPIGLKPGALPYTAQFADIPVIRHAVSIDERRAFFRQNLIHPLDPAKGQDLKQLWFAGVHSDVGGSYPEAESGLSKIALRWMLNEAVNTKLIVDPAKMSAMLGGDGKHAKPDPTAQMHNSLTPAWWLGEIWPKRTMIPVVKPGEEKVEWKGRIRFNLWRRRFMAEGAHLHASVKQRMDRVSSYRPSNLPKSYVVEPDDSSVPVSNMVAGHEG